MSQIPPKQRIAIIGGGVSGLSAAYFLEDAADVEVTLYERDSRLGGHAVTMDAKTPDGKAAAVDPVVYLFLPERYPYFTEWLSQLGVATRPLEFDSYLWDGHFGHGTHLTANFGKILRSQCKSVRYFRNLYSMLQVVRTIKKLDREGKLKGNLTMAEFIAQVPRIDARFVDEVFYPLLHLAFHATQDEMPNLPVSSFLPTWASAADGASTFYVVDGGVKNYVETVRQSLAATNIKTGADVVALSHTSEGWQTTDANGHCATYDQVILAIWPNQVAEILQRGMEQSAAIRPQLEATVNTLSKVELAHCRAVIHNDTGLMPPDRNAWPSYSYKNIPYLKTGLSTIWSGQLDQTEVFTSFDWSMDMEDLSDARAITRPRGPIHGVHLHSRTPPRQALYEARAFVQQQQGRHGLWFTGSYLRETCFHEDGLAASLEVIKRLRPDHANLGRLGKLLGKIPTPWRE